MALRRIQDMDIKGKRVLIRVDMNVPIEGGVVRSFKRIDASLPTIRYVIEHGGTAILVSHLGRPTEGIFNPTLSLAPVAEVLSQRLGFTVPLCSLDTISADASVVLCENIRFEQGEKECLDALSEQLASLCDIFVMDAFGSAHRKHASTYGVAKYIRHSCAGLLLQAEIEALDNALLSPERPRVAIIGGSKVSTKLAVLENLRKSLDSIIVGGGIANTFLLAQGYAIGKSLCEPDFVSKAKELLANTDIILPVDVAVVKEISPKSAVLYKSVDSIADDDIIVDVGIVSSARYDDILLEAKTILWNGPVGIFEIPSMATGTEELCNSVASSKAFSLVGGGDTIRAVEQFGIVDAISYISTGGGAFLEYVEGKEFPILSLLKE